HLDEPVGNGRSAAPNRVESGEQTESLDRLGGKSETVDRLALRVEQRDAGCRGERIAGQESGKYGAGRGNRNKARRAVGQDDDETREKDGRHHKEDKGQRNLGASPARPKEDAMKQPEIKSRLRGLSEHGQSVWIDYLSRDLLETGELARLIDRDAVVGVTSNPTIFQKAIS